MMMDNNFEKAFGIWTVRNTTQLPMNCLPLPAMLFWRDGLPQEGVCRLPDISLRDMEKRMNLKIE